MSVLPKRLCRMLADDVLPCRILPGAREAICIPLKACAATRSPGTTKSPREDTAIVAYAQHDAVSALTISATTQMIKPLGPHDEQAWPTVSKLPATWRKVIFRRSAPIEAAAWRSRGVASDGGCRAAGIGINGAQTHWCHVLRQSTQRAGVFVVKAAPGAAIRQRHSHGALFALNKMLTMD